MHWEAPTNFPLALEAEEKKQCLMTFSPVIAHGNKEMFSFAVKYCAGNVSLAPVSVSASNFTKPHYANAHSFLFSFFSLYLTLSHICTHNTITHVG